MTEFFRVVDAPNLVRDPVSKALLGVDPEAKREHRKKKAFMQGIVAREEILRKELQELKGEIVKIQSILTELQEKIING